VFDGFQVLIDVKVRIQWNGRRQPDVGPQHRLYLPHAIRERAAGKQEFHTIAGGKENQFIHMIQMREHMQRIYFFAACHRKLLPYFHGSRLVTHT
jgi:hypothetical protein